MSDWNEKIIAEFRANSGRVGGNFQGAPLLLLHSVGARSGEPRVHPMMYQALDDGWAVFASYAGLDVNPAWFHNLKANPDVSIEIGADGIVEDIDVRARVLDPAGARAGLGGAEAALPRVRRLRGEDGARHPRRPPHAPLTNA